MVLAVQPERVGLPLKGEVVDQVGQMVGLLLELALALALIIL
jgi:hypothetical protein